MLTVRSNAPNTCVNVHNGMCDAQTHYTHHVYTMMRDAQPQCIHYVVVHGNVSMLARDAQHVTYSFVAMCD